MSDFLEKLEKVNTFIIDIDGVLTSGRVFLTANGEQLRSMLVKDGYAIQYAIKQGYNIAVISGGSSQSVKPRLKYLGIKDIYIGSKNKVKDFEEFLEDKKIHAEQVVYMGDDIPDYYVMQLCGVKTCPKNAAPEILAISDYISDKKGGEGCARDIIEKVLRLHNKWFKPENI
ncbi:MAG TPA: 3-deoxy-D-manno-octulosonate 8-phosphate phosphatase [Flavobacteriales bacterium]|nr:3-deoxy-D-manno-octulosonate 8-phosphate phosphatase [Flavobacteriales bacterium]